MGDVLVIGSLNVDLVVRCPRMPESGETVFGTDLQRHAGGKGLNQAIAAARAGASVSMCGAVGDDDSGAWLREQLRRDSVDDGLITAASGPSGTALIEVDDAGRNRIVVISAANTTVTPDHTIAAISAASDDTIVLAGFEVPMETVTAGIIAARERGLTTIVNPAPALAPPAELLAATDVLIPNEHEVLALTDADAIDTAIAQLHASGVRDIIVTLGENGARWSNIDGDRVMPTFLVDAVDTVAAGDAFCGALAATLASGAGLEDAIRRALAAGALAVTRAGAVPSLPTAERIDALLAGSPIP
jgi:ribokinase